LGCDGYCRRWGIDNPDNLLKILFVYPNVTRQTTPQVGIASLLTLIKKKHEVVFFDLTVVKHGEEYGNYLDYYTQFKPDIILVSCRTNEWGYVKRIIEISYPTPIVVGGIHPTVAIDEVLTFSKIALVGEAEGVIEELLDKISKGKDISKIPNVCVKQGGKIIKNDVLPLIQDLDSLPIPAWEFFHPIHFRGSYIRNLFSEIRCVGTFETTRGCPYACTYCANYFLHSLYKDKGKFHRRKSPERVVREVKAFKELYPDCNFIYFVDDTFMVDKDWLEKFANLYDNTPFVFMTRAEMVTKEKMQLIADMGGKAVSIGIESGNEKFRKEVYERRMSNEQIIQAFKTAKDFGLHTYSFNMVGAPYETPNDIQSTIDLNKKINPNIAQFTTFFPLPGTKLFDICKKEGYLNGNYPEIFNYYSESILKLPNFKKGEIEEWHKKAEKDCQHIPENYIQQKL
jgi:radical SAM superfamily enzyme YgiQ (UPF0313 family)